MTTCVVDAPGTVASAIDVPLWQGEKGVIVNRSLSRTRLALAAVGGVVAMFAMVPGASAQTACVNPSLTVNGEGASFQRSAQLAWGARILAPNPADPLAQGFGYDVPGCDEFQLGPPPNEVHYAPTGSGAGRTAFGANGDGTTRESDKDFGGVDEAPTATQLAAANEGAPGSGDEMTLHTIPVAQSSIVVAVRLPDGCQAGDFSVEWPVQLTRLQVEGAFAGDSAVDTWGELLPGIQGAGCAAKQFEQVVRFDSSGTTFQFKKYLQAAADEEGTGRAGSGWSGLGNTAWPTAVTKPASNGNGPLLDLLATQAANGGIGYSDLATARSKQFAHDGNDSDTTLWAYVQRINDDDFAGPAEEADGDLQDGTPGSACEAVEYDGDPNTGGLQLPDTNQSWFDVDAVDTAVQYPICTLTYALAWENPCENGSTEERAVTTREYLGYVTDPDIGIGGQRLLAENDYAALTTAVGTKARAGVGQLTWGSC
jgi:ABC-type phosphate transport system substrate-binding protein